MSVFSLRRPTDSDLELLVRQQAADGALSYGEVGATAGPLPVGYRHDHWQVDLGPDTDDRFRRASDALMNWQPQRGAGLRIFPDHQVEADATFALVIRIAAGFVTAAGRVVYLVDDPNRSGFAYGTLRAHPEQGEESFIVVRGEDRVRFEILSFSRPRHALARLGSPITRLLQVRTTNAYLRAMQIAAA